MKNHTQIYCGVVFSLVCLILSAATNQPPMMLIIFAVMAVGMLLCFWWEFRTYLRKKYYVES